MRSTDRSSRCIVVLAGALLVATPTAASAQTPDEKETARTLFNDGADLREKGRPKEAVDKLAAAYRLVPTPIIGLELVKTHVALDALVEARRVALTIADLPVAAEETERSRAARKEAADLAAGLDERIPKLTVKVSSDGDDARWSLAIDDKEVPTASASGVLRLDPGAHRVTVRGVGEPRTQSVTLALRDVRTLTFDLRTNANAPPAPVSPPPAPEGPPPPPPTKTGPSPLVWGGYGVGGVGLVVGVIAGLVALNKASAVDDACIDTRCRIGTKSEWEAGRTAATFSTIGFVVAGVGAAVGTIALVVTNKKAGDAAAVRR